MPLNKHTPTHTHTHTHTHSSLIRTHTYTKKYYLCAATRALRDARVFITPLTIEFKQHSIKAWQTKKPQTNLLRVV